MAQVDCTISNDETQTHAYLPPHVQVYRRLIEAGTDALAATTAALLRGDGSTDAENRLYYWATRLGLPAPVVRQQAVIGTVTRTDASRLSREAGARMSEQDLRRAWQLAAKARATCYASWRGEPPSGG